MKIFNDSNFSDDEPLGDDARRLLEQVDLATAMAEASDHRLELRDIVWHAQIEPDSVSLQPIGAFGCRESGSLSLSLAGYEGAINVHDDPLPPLDLSDDSSHPYLDEGGRWWLLAAVFWSSPFDPGIGGSFGDLGGVITNGVSTLFSERRDGLAKAGLSPEDEPAMVKYLCRKATLGVLLATEPDPLLAWASSAANEHHGWGLAESPLTRFGNIVLEEMIGDLFEVPVEERLPAQVVRGLAWLAWDHYHANEAAFKDRWQATIPTVLMGLYADLELNKGTAGRQIARLLLELGLHQKQIDLVREAVFGLWNRQMELRWSPVQEALDTFFGLPPERIERIVQRLRSEVLPAQA